MKLGLIVEHNLTIIFGSRDNRKNSRWPPCTWR